VLLLLNIIFLCAESVKAYSLAALAPGKNKKHILQAPKGRKSLESKTYAPLGLKKLYWLHTWG